jgi:hypothetical protein
VDVCRRAFDKICNASANIRLAPFEHLHDTAHMNFDGQASNGSASVMATARYDRGPAGANASDSLMSIARQFRLAMIFKIPVGYQDKKGFHRGQPRVEKTAPVFEPEEIKTNTYQF